MIFVCEGCGKKFLYRGDPAAAPPCKACGGRIRPEEPAAPATAGTDPRVAELEAQLKARDEEIRQARERLAALEADAQEAGAQIEALQAQLSEAMDRQERLGVEREREIGEARARIAQLEKELQEARAEATSRLQAAVVRSLKEKEQELHEAQASIARLGEELKKAQDLYKEALTRRDREAEEHAAATVEAQASIARLGEDLKKAQDAYKEALKRKDEELAEAHAKIEVLERRLAEAPAAEGPAGEDPRMKALQAELAEKTSDLDRAQSRIRQLEKIVLDAEQKYIELQKQMEAVPAAPPSPPPGGDETVSRLRTELAARTSEVEDLRRRIADLERAKGQEEEKARERDRRDEDFRANVKEARYLAEDLARNFESLATTMSGLVERTRRLIECLHQPEPVIPSHVVPGSPAALAETPPGPGMLPPQALAQAAAVPVLEEVPAPPPEEAPGHLPADDSILEMGGAVKPAPEAPSSPEEAVEASAPEGTEAAPETAPAEAEAAQEAGVFPPPPPEAGEEEKPTSRSLPRAAPMKKKGFLRRLFGRS